MTTRRELVEHLVLARHGRLVAVRRLLGFVERPRHENGVRDAPPVRTRESRCRGCGAPAGRKRVRRHCRAGPQIALNNSNGCRHCSQYITALHAVGPNTLRMVVACDPQYGQATGATRRCSGTRSSAPAFTWHTSRRRDPVRLELAPCVRPDPVGGPHWRIHGTEPRTRPSVARQCLLDVVLDDLQCRTPGVGRRDRHGHLPVGIDLDVAHDAEFHDAQDRHFGIWNALECRPHGCEIVRRGYHFAPGNDRCRICISASMMPRCSVCRPLLPPRCM